MVVGAGLLILFAAGAAGAVGADPWFVPGGAISVGRTPVSVMPAMVRDRALSGRLDAVFSTRGLIKKLVADGNQVAVATTKLKGKCGMIVVWTAPGRKSTSFEANACASLLCATACASDLALGAGRVAWITYAGGNLLELTVWAKKLSGGAVKMIDDVVNGNGANQEPSGDYVGWLFGGGPLLAYNQWTVCVGVDMSDDPCPPVDRASHVPAKDELKLVSAAGSSVVVKQGIGSYRLEAVGGARMAVQSAGSITVLASSGALLGTVPAVQGNALRAIALSGTWLGVERTSTLDLYDPATGSKSANSLALGTAATLLLGGVNSKLALFRSVRRLVLVRLSDGKRISLPLQPGTKSIIDARLTESGLFYAYNIPRAPEKGRIVFEPTTKLLTRF